LRESLTIFAGILILILTMALVGPYFVDWTAERGWIEKLLSDATGAQVEVAGAIDVKLLPTPSLHLEKVVMHGATPGDPSFRADKLELQMAVSPLLRGEVQFIEASFEAPELRLTLGPDGGVVLPRAPAALPAAMQFSAISLHHGRLTVDDPSSHRSLSLDDLDLDAQADSLIGPFAGSGHFARSSGASVGFNFSTTARQGDQINLKALVDATSTSPAVEFEGAVDFSAEQAGATRVSLDGRATVSGTLALPGSSRLPWRIAGPVKADARRVTFTALELRLGNEDRALTATGTGEIDLQDALRAHASLSAQQIDLGNLLASKNGSKADPTSFVAAISSLLADPNFSNRAPMPLQIDFRSPAIVLNGETLTGLAAKLDLHAGAPVGLDFKAGGPGQSHLGLSGSVETGPAADFKGHIQASVYDKARFAGWLRSVLPEFSARLRLLPFRTADFAGDVEVSGAGFVGRGLTIRADRSNLAGTLAYTRALGPERARFFADLSADALDLDALPDLSSPAAAMADTDLELNLDARAVRVARFGQGVADSGRIRLALTKAGSSTTLENLSIADLGGASVHVTGSATPEALRLDANLDADKLDELAGLLRRAAPGDAADMLAARAAALSPAHLELAASVHKQNDAITLTALSLTGTAHGTKIEIGANPDPGDPQGISAKLALDSTDASNLLRQIGLEALPLSGFGRGHIGVAASGKIGGDFDTKFDGSFAGTDLGFRGRIGGSVSMPHGSGVVTVKSGNIAPLTAIAAIALPDATARLAADLSGNVSFDAGKIAVSGITGSFAGTGTKGDLSFDLVPGTARPQVGGTLAFDHLSLPGLASLILGASQPAAKGALWPSAPFGAGLATVPTTDLALSADSFDLAPGATGRQASLHLSLSAGTLMLSDVAMKAGSGSLGGQVTLRRDGAGALLAGHLQLSGLAFQAPYASGQASAALDFTATGRSEAALAASLAGGGTVQLAGLTVEKGDPAALARIIAATDRGTVAVDEPEVRSALGRELDHSALHLADATYQANMAAGVLRLSPQNASGATPSPGGGGLSASLDLQHATIDARLAIASPSLPRDWTGPQPQATLIWQGPIGAPKRDLDSGAFFNALAARALVREAARVDIFEQDIRERAYFNRYLKGLQFMRRRRKEIAAFEAEQARQAEAARRAAEQARQAEAARSLVPPPAPPGPIILHPPVSPPTPAPVPQP
jgi:uncharacterized protein involved in outer membrane biogenesis